MRPPANFGGVGKTKTETKINQIILLLFQLRLIAPNRGFSSSFFRLKNMQGALEQDGDILPEEEQDNVIESFSMQQEKTEKFFAQLLFLVSCPFFVFFMFQSYQQMVIPWYFSCYELFFIIQDFSQGILVDCLAGHGHSKDFVDPMR